MNPTDARALAALEAQLRQLSVVLGRLAVARGHLVPADATFWHGSARAAYDHALQLLDTDIAATLDVVRFAQQNTRLAIAEMESRV